MAKTNKTSSKAGTKAGTKAGAGGGTDNTDTSLNGEFRAGAGIYVNARGEWTDPNGTVLRGEALMKAEANASAKYGVGYRDENLYIQAVAEAKLRAECALKAEMENGQNSAGVELYAYAELYAWAGAEANVGKDGCWFEGGAIAGAKAGAGTKTYYTNESLGLGVTNNTSASVGAQAGGTMSGGYQVPDWNKDSKPITIGGSINLALIVGVKTEGTVTVDVDPAYDAIVKTNNKLIKEADELLKSQEAERVKKEAAEAQRKLEAAAVEAKRVSDAAAAELANQTNSEATSVSNSVGKATKKTKKWLGF